MVEQYQLEDGGEQQAEQVVEGEPEYQEREVHELSLPLETEEDQGEDQQDQVQQQVIDFELDEEIKNDEDDDDDDEDELQLEQQEEEDYEMDIGYGQITTSANNNEQLDNLDQNTDTNTDNNNNNTNQDNNNSNFRKNKQGGHQFTHIWPKHKYAVISECVEYIRSEGGSVDGKSFNRFLISLKVQGFNKKRLKKVMQAANGDLVWDKKLDTISLKNVAKKIQQAQQLEKQQQQQQQQQQAAGGGKKKGYVEKGGKGSKKDVEDYNWHAVNQIVCDYLGTGGQKSVGEVLDYMYRHVRNPGKVDLYKFLKTNKNIQLSKHYVQLSQKYKFAEQRKRKRDKDTENVRSRDRINKRRQSSPRPQFGYQDTLRHPYSQDDHIYRSAEAHDQQHPYRQFGTFQQQQYQQMQQLESPLQLQQLMPQVPQQVGNQMLQGQVHNQLELQAQGGMDSTCQLAVDQGHQMNLQRQAIQPVLQVGNMDSTPVSGMYGGQIMNNQPASIQGQIIQLPNGDMYIVKGSQGTNVQYSFNG